MKLIDKKKTCINVINLLKDYQMLLHIVKRQDPTCLQSPVINGMPSSKTYKNRVEDKMIIYTNAKLVISEINSCLKQMDKMKADILRDLYIKNVPITQTQACQKYYLSQPTIKRYRDKGLLEFANLYSLEDLNYYSVEYLNKCSN